MFNKSDDSSFSLIMHGTIIDGSGINSKNNIRLNCKVIGNITCSNTVIIGDHSVIEGNIQGKIVDISGKVRGGEILAEKELYLRSSSVVESNLNTPWIMIEPGAKFNGKCNMTNQGAKTQRTDDEAIKK